MIEGGIESGNGRLLRLHGLEAETKPQLQILASNMDLPVNLTILGQEVWVTESLFRHRLVPGKETEIPERFLIRRFMRPSENITWLLIPDVNIMKLA